MAVIAAILCGMIIGAINGYFASYIGLMPFIVTLATQMTVRGLAYLIAGGAPVYGVSSSIIFLGQGNVGGFPMLLIVVLVATAIMLFVMTRTSHGRYLYAIGGNPEAASASGINVKRQVFVNYIIMGLMCAFAGILYAGRTNSGLPAGGVNFEFEAIIGSVLGGTSMAGGIGNVAMSIVGIYVVGIINNVMNLCSVNAFWQQVVKGIVILIAVLLDIFTRNAIMKSTKSVKPLVYGFYDRTMRKRRRKKNEKESNQCTFMCGNGCDHVSWMWRKFQRFQVIWRRWQETCILGYVE